MNKRGFFGKLIILGFILVFILGIYFTIKVLSDFSLSNKDSIRNSSSDTTQDNNSINNSTNSSNSTLTNSTGNYSIVEQTP